MRRGGRDKFSKAQLRENHGETCRCRRCRARDEALERRSPRQKSRSSILIEYSRFDET